MLLAALIIIIEVPLALCRNAHSVYLLCLLPLNSLLTIIQQLSRSLLDSNASFLLFHIKQPRYERENEKAARFSTGQRSFQKRTEESSRWCFFLLGQALCQFLYELYNQSHFLRLLSGCLASQRWANRNLLDHLVLLKEGGNQSCKNHWVTGGFFVHSLCVSNAVQEKRKPLQ
jgi:hypothetical protein